MLNKEEVQRRICDFIRDGDTQANACKKAGIGHSQFHKWKKTDENFAIEIEKAKEEFRSKIVGELEVSLWKKAKGYEVEEVESEFILGKNGEGVLKKQVTKKKYIAPDTGAIIFALTNLDPEKWKNKQVQEVKADVKNNVEIEKRYSVDDLPEDLCIEVANKLQEAEYERIKREKGESK